MHGCKVDPVAHDLDAAWCEAVAHEGAPQGRRHADRAVNLSVNPVKQRMESPWHPFGQGMIKVGVYGDREWAARHPTRLFACAPICTAARHSAQNIAFHEVGRQAIMTDVGWSDGRYLERGTFPVKGLAVEGEQVTVLELRVAPGDLGKVIGKQGRTARSIRTILGAAGMKLNRRFTLEILE